MVGGWWVVGGGWWVVDALTHATLDYRLRLCAVSFTASQWCMTDTLGVMRVKTRARSRRAINNIKYKYPRQGRFEVIAAWPNLPEALKAGILAMVAQSVTTVAP